MKTQKEKNIQAEKEKVNNKYDECDICRYKSIMIDGIMNRFYVCRYFHEILNYPARAEICFDTFGMAGENNTGPAPDFDVNEYQEKLYKSVEERQKKYTAPTDETE